MFGLDFNHTEFQNIGEVIVALINYAYQIAPFITMIYIILGGYRYVLAGGNQEKAQAAKSTVVNAIKGLVVILVSYLLVDYVLSLLGADPELFQPWGFLQNIE